VPLDLSHVPAALAFAFAFALAGRTREA
jgi:hypothetical protein